MTEKLSRDEFIKKLQHNIAGETIIWKSYERFNIGALPKTLSTLMKVEKAEAYMEAVQDKMLTPGMKISIITIAVIAIIGMIILVVARNMGLLG